ncbi:nitrilase-related carbon-nitrogen hydrolase [Streptomyces sp. NPDC004646]
MEEPVRRRAGRLLADRRHPIGRLGVMMANEASHPENVRGLARGGCEIAYRTSYPLPGVASDAFDIQNRARALDNTMYVLAPNPASYTSVDGQPIDFFGGHSTITDYTGRTTGHLDHGGVATFVTATIDLALCAASAPPRHGRTGPRICGPICTAPCTTSPSTRRTSTPTARRTTTPNTASTSPIPRSS